jgi:hypothetical protein
MLDYLDERKQCESITYYASVVRCQSEKYNKKPESERYKAVNSVISPKDGEMVEGGREER